MTWRLVVLLYSSFFSVQSTKWLFEAGEMLNRYREADQEASFDCLPPGLIFWNLARSSFQAHKISHTLASGLACHRSYICTVYRPRGYHHTLSGLVLGRSGDMNAQRIAHAVSYIAKTLAKFSVS